MDEAAHTVIARARLLQNLFDGRAIAETNRGASRVNCEVSREIPRDLGVVLQDQLLELANIGEGPAIRQLPVRFDGQGIMKIKWPAVLALAHLRDLVLGVTAIAIAPGTHHIK